MGGPKSPRISQWLYIGVGYQPENQYSDTFVKIMSVSGVSSDHSIIFSPIQANITTALLPITKPAVEA